MANIIRGEEVARSGVRPALFNGEVATPSAGRPLAAPRVDRQGMALPAPVEARPLPAPEPAAVSEPPREVAPPPPPPPPVFEVPPEILEAFYQQAIAVGLEDGKNQVFAELTVLQERYAAALDQLLSVSRELEAQNRMQLIGLSCRVAERLVRKHLSVNPQDLLAIIAEALKSIETKDRVVITCSPPDHEYLVTRRAELASATGAQFTVEVRADAGLEYGDFRVETEFGASDGRVATRIAEAEQALRSGDV